MKIHFPLLGFNLSGGVRVVLRLAAGLVDAGHRVRITVPASRSTPPFPVDERVEVRTVARSNSSRIAMLASLSREVAGWGDVLVATGFATPYLLQLSRLLRGRRPPILYLVQGYEPTSKGDLLDGPAWRGSAQKRLASWSYRLAEKRVYVSDAIAERVGLDPEPLLVRPGVDRDVFHLGERVSGDPVRIGAIAHESRLKGYSIFLEAWRFPSDPGDRIRPVLLTFGSPHSQVPAGAEVLEGGNDEAVARFYRSVDVFVFPSLFEGFGLPPLEAMACGAAVVSSDCGGVREYAKDGVNCLLVAPGDPGALSAAIRRLAPDSVLRAALAAGGTRTAAEFTWERTTREFLAALEGFEPLAD